VFIPQHGDLLSCFSSIFPDKSLRYMCLTSSIAKQSKNAVKTCGAFSVAELYRFLAVTPE
jgi:hypothetical protein